MERITLEKIVAPDGNPLYSELPQSWHIQDIKGFSKDKELFDYQMLALKNIGTVLYLHFTNKLKKEYYDKHGITTADKQINRACFWMATGSGKTLVLIKTIEYLDYLMSQGLIPQKEIMLLLPRDDLIIQFQKQIKEYNDGRSKIIRAVNLLDYENDTYNHSSFNLGNEIKVYYYRSDLMRNEKKESIVNYESYLNGGEWYLFLDEAHRGDSENSNLKFYVNELTQNGFLFNFSATFTDDIDIISTCYNFNLERFISAGYGKNIYVSDSNYTFNQRSDEFTDAEKQKQVLKSFIIFTILKKSHKDGFYHNPLMLTLVNSVQARAKTTNSDLKMFCEYMLRIAQNDAALSKALSEAKSELKTEFSTNKEFKFGSEKLKIKSDVIDGITLEHIRASAFNSATKGNLEYYEGEKGKEIIFKLATSSEPFALIKIGDTATFIKEYLAGYQKLASFTPKNYMQDINSPGSAINILLGSRAFYEGWDSNRPNIINMVNIGKGDAQKFVPQSIGRGVRIQPDPNNTSERKRLQTNSSNKNPFLETLFIFPSDKKSIETILGAMAELGGQNKRGAKRVRLYSPELFETSPKQFELFVPVYEEKTDSAALPFNIANTSKEKFISLLEEMPPAVFILQNHKSYSNSWSLDEYLKLRTFSHFVSAPNRDYHSLDNLVSDLHRHINTKEKVLNSFRPLAENNSDDTQNDIIHYKYIEVDELSEEEIENLKAKIKNVVNYKKHYTDDELIAMLTKKEITADEFTEMRSSTKEALFKDLSISYMVEHYYLPLVYSNSEKVDYINHIIKTESEKTFIDNLLKYLETNTVDCEWMFSKIDETLDKISMPYLKDNEYHDFYPDFIFWLKKGDTYKIVFVDPKGGTQAASELKIDGFNKLFNGQKIRQDIQMELQMIGDWSGGSAYKPYWARQGDFSFLNFVNKAMSACPQEAGSRRSPAPGQDGHPAAGRRAGPAD